VSATSRARPRKGRPFLAVPLLVSCDTPVTMAATCSFRGVARVPGSRSQTMSVIRRLQLVSWSITTVALLAQDDSFSGSIRAVNRVRETLRLAAALQFHTVNPLALRLSRSHQCFGATAGESPFRFFYPAPGFSP